MMIIENEKAELVIKVDNNDYVISNNDDYQKIVLMLTDPSSNLISSIEIDESVLEGNKLIAENYKNFINDFLQKKKDVLEKNSSSTNNTEEGNGVINNIDLGNG
ncbi:MAG: hypothetical protein PHI05_00070 [Bacilli bacterium]|nr:hypothetical protein [Bacilli bacterium]